MYNTGWNYYTYKQQRRIPGLNRLENIKVFEFRGVMLGNIVQF